MSKNGFQVLTGFILKHFVLREDQSVKITLITYFRTLIYSKELS